MSLLSISLQVAAQTDSLAPPKESGSVVSRQASGMKEDADSTSIMPRILQFEIGLSYSNAIIPDASFNGGLRGGSYERGVYLKHRLYFGIQADLRFSSLVNVYRSDRNGRILDTLPQYCYSMGAGLVFTKPFYLLGNHISIQPGLSLGFWPGLILLRGKTSSNVSNEYDDKTERDIVSFGGPKLRIQIGNKRLFFNIRMDYLMGADLFGMNGGYYGFFCINSGISFKFPSGLKKKPVHF